MECECAKLLTDFFKARRKKKTESETGNILQNGS